MDKERPWHEWRPINERPPIGKYVLIVVREGDLVYVSLGRFDGMSWMGREGLPGEITHWMPMPPLPEEVAHDRT